MLDYIENHVAKVQGQEDGDEALGTQNKSRFKFSYPTPPRGTGGSRTGTLTMSRENTASGLPAANGGGPAFEKADGFGAIKEETESPQHAAPRDKGLDTTNNTGMYDLGMSDQDSPVSAGPDLKDEEHNFNRHTLFTEVEVIDIGIQIVNLLEILHEQNLVHTNLNPENIFLVDGRIDKMCFLNLYHCSWNTKATLSNPHVGAEFEDNITVYDIRTRDKDYISPEQVRIGNDLADVVYQRNGKVDESQIEVKDFLQQQKGEKASITKRCDIYSVGAIMFKLLLGTSPTSRVLNFIQDRNSQEMTPEQNVYTVPPFFKDCIISNDMIYIIVKLLHPEPDCRFQDISEVKQALFTLRDNILRAPDNLKMILEHPVIPNQPEQATMQEQQRSFQFQQYGEGNVSFRNQAMSEFGLKYLGKFIYGKKIESIAINGGFMPLHTISMDNITLLNLSNQGLYSEDLFILSQYLKRNQSITHLNLSKNCIGRTSTGR